MEELEIRCLPNDPQAMGKEHRGVFDEVVGFENNEIPEQEVTGSSFSGIVHFLEKQTNHQQIISCATEHQIQHRFTFEEALFLANKIATVFPQEGEWRVIIYLYCTCRYLSISSRKVSIANMTRYNKRILCCKEVVPFYHYPKGTGVLLRS
jgi:hypothetical protein